MRIILTSIAFIFTTQLLIAQNMGNNEKYLLWGEFKIVKFYNGNISAMTTSEAQNWVGKTVFFHDSIYLNLPTPIRTKNGFSYSHCNIKKEFQVKTINQEQFLSDYKTSAKTLGISSRTIKYISINTCDVSPFSSIYIKDNGNIIISWDGIFFELSRLKS